jgi:hypothetical protein
MPMRASAVTVLAFLLLLTVLLASAIIILPSNTKLASAHVTKQFGNIQVEAGWSNEPPLVGEMNNILVEVRNGTGDNVTAVRNALANMDISLKYGGLTKPIDFEPSEEEGQYLSPIIPTRLAGPYVVVLKGNIQGQSIDDEIQIEDVEGKEKLSFPDTTGTDSGTSNNIGPRIEGIVSQLANDIDSAKGSSDTLTKSMVDMQKAIQDVKAAADRSYMIGVAGIGAGVAGIVIAAISLSRKAFQPNL